VISLTLITVSFATRLSNLKVEPVEAGVALSPLLQAKSSVIMLIPKRIKSLFMLFGLLNE
jgi:hypothetical protein